MNPTRSTARRKTIDRQLSIERQEALKSNARPKFERSFSSSGEFNVPAPTHRKRNVWDVLSTVRNNQESGDTAKTILVRVDFNVPMNPDLTISDDSRIRGALPTIQAIISAKCNVVLVSHMGRPKAVQKGDDLEKAASERKKLSLKVAAERLSDLLGIAVSFASDCIGSVAEESVAALPSEGGGVLVLENLRFYKEEEKNGEKFARSLSELADAYINDAFGTCHRAHASVTGVPALMNPFMCGVGCLVASEVAYLDFDHMEPGSSVTAIIGGSKVSTKLPVIKGLLEKVDILVLGGGLAFTFLAAQGIPVGNSLMEESMVDTAKELLASAESNGKRIVLPVDAVCAQSFPTKALTPDETATFDLSPSSGIEKGWSGFDVGPKTLELLKTSLDGSTKLVFNGPLGVFEVGPFDKGTAGLVNILEGLTKCGTITVVGGGDSVAALEAFGKTDVVSYISTGGGATLELLSGAKLPGVEAISNVEVS